MSYKFSSKNMFSSYICKFSKQRRGDTLSVLQSYSLGSTCNRLRFISAAVNLFTAAFGRVHDHTQSRYRHLIKYMGFLSNYFFLTFHE